MSNPSEKPSSDKYTHSEHSFRSGTLKALSVGYEILLDFILVAILLLTLSLIHSFTHIIPLSEGFIHIFNPIHECVWIANYILLAFKSILRFWNHF